MSEPIRSQVSFGKRKRRVIFNATKRMTTAERGYDYDWQKFQSDYIKANPLCVNYKQCKSGAQCVDHKKPLSLGGARLDPDNCQSMCWSCHSKKTQKEKQQIMEAKSNSTKR